MQAACVKAQRDGRARKSVVQEWRQGRPVLPWGSVVLRPAEDWTSLELSCRKDLPKERWLQLIQAKAEQE